MYVHMDICMKYFKTFIKNEIQSILFWHKKCEDIYMGDLQEFVENVHCEEIVDGV